MFPKFIETSIVVICASALAIFATPTGRIALASLPTSNLSIVPNNFSSLHTRVAPGEHERVVVGGGYATFYDSNNCKGQNHGIDVALSNPHCLANEYGRNSVFIQVGTDTARMLKEYSFVFSPAPDCDCQVQCVTIVANHATENSPAAPPSANDANNANSNNGKYSSKNFCYDLNGHAAATSFRIIEGSCGRNTC